MRIAYAQGRARKVAESSVATEPRMVLEESSGVGLLSDGAARVDTANKVIRGVKILGLESGNTGRVLGLSEMEFGDAVNEPYAYTMECLRQAAPLYEGATVYSNHVEFGYTEDGHRYVKGDGRKNDDMAGWLSNVKAIEGKGLYADLNYYDAGSGTGILVEVAMRRPDQLALSHEAEFDGPELINGRIYLTKIVAVNAVAIVNGTPGTTNGLFEQHAPTKGVQQKPSIEEKQMRSSLRQIIESSPATTKGRAMLIEMFGGDEQDLGPEADILEVDFGSDVDAVPEDEQVRAGLLATVTAALDKASIGQIERALKALSGVAEAEVPAELGDEAVPADGEALDSAVPAADAAVVDAPAGDIVADEDKPVVVEAAAGEEIIDGSAVACEAAAATVADEPAGGGVDSQIAAEAAAAVHSASDAMACLDVLEQAGAPRDRDLVEAMLGLPEDRRAAFAAKIASMQVAESVIQFPGPRK